MLYQENKNTLRKLIYLTSLLKHLINNQFINNGHRAVKSYIYALLSNTLCTFVYLYSMAWKK